MHKSTVLIYGAVVVQYLGRSGMLRVEQQNVLKWKSRAKYFMTHIYWVIWYCDLTSLVTRTVVTWLVDVTYYREVNGRLSEKDYSRHEMTDYYASEARNELPQTLRMVYSTHTVESKSKSRTEMTFCAFKNSPIGLLWKYKTEEYVYICTYVTLLSPSRPSLPHVAQLAQRGRVEKWKKAKYFFHFKKLHNAPVLFSFRCPFSQLVLFYSLSHPHSHFRYSVTGFPSLVLDFFVLSLTLSLCTSQCYWWGEWPCQLTRTAFILLSECFQSECRWIICKVYCMEVDVWQVCESDHKAFTHTFTHTVIPWKSHMHIECSYAQISTWISIPGSLRVFSCNSYSV